MLHDPEYGHTGRPKGELLEKTDDLILELIEDVKKTEWYHVADYYLALRYIFNTVYNSLSFEVNREVGMEMMCALAAVNNPYAFDYLELITELFS